MTKLENIIAKLNDNTNKLITVDIPRTLDKPEMQQLRDLFQRLVYNRKENHLTLLNNCSLSSIFVDEFIVELVYKIDVTDENSEAKTKIAIENKEPIAMVVPPYISFNNRKYYFKPAVAEKFAIESALRYFEAFNVRFTNEFILETYYCHKSDDEIFDTFLYLEYDLPERIEFEEFFSLFENINEEKMEQLITETLSNCEDEINNRFPHVTRIAGEAYFLESDIYQFLKNNRSDKSLFTITGGVR